MRLSKPPETRATGTMQVTHQEPSLPKRLEGASVPFPDQVRASEALPKRARGWESSRRSWSPR